MNQEKSPQIDGSSIKAVFFDRGNVLYNCRNAPDDEILHVNAARNLVQTFNQFSIHTNEIEIRNKLINPWAKSLHLRKVRGLEFKVENFLKDFLETKKQKVTYEEENVVIEDLAVSYLQWDNLEPNALNLLEMLQKKNIKIGIIANTIFPASVFEQQLMKDGIYGYIDACILSYEIGTRKPDPRMIQESCNLFGIAPSESIFVGDQIEIDTRCALNAGALSVWYNPDHRENNSDINPNYEIKSLNEMMEWIAKPARPTEPGTTTFWHCHAENHSFSRH